MGCALLLQIGVNLANDYFDFRSGVDTDDRLGPMRVTQQGLIAPEKVRNAMALSLVAAVAVGLYLIYIGGPIVAFLAAFSVLGALCYSGGPYPLASHGLGEVAAFVYFGLVAIVGVYFIHTGTTHADAWILASCLGLLNAAIMLVNNTRDISTDQKAGKRTLAVRIGLANARSLYTVLLFAPIMLTILQFLLLEGSGWLALAVGLTLPMARSLANAFQQSQGAALNPLLGRTALLTLMFSLAYSVGLALSVLFPAQS
ncbi:1,4-dihydroxy-2-naphthoate octaprenyltransferase [Paraferrimonas sedimenticola]|uniref:1,4-dihydroxy-2-naphthoate octaprenyltransferase n=2 Tax=Paraferrimonas sedimenticola TaxID=375674 RepID=A0AA37VWC2_9GAMM|nr:1,4-dihydroxy-2-naphthoate octaprenyltransferase [Paraferrimonas sedimenticola]